VLVAFDAATVRYEPEARIRDGLALAYALTIHRSQGSEYPCSIVVAHHSHRSMLHRNLLYVGATRAKRTAVLIGDRFTLEAAAQRVDTSKRRTFLSFFTSEGQA
jgi:exodeoxyribonuclease V alpha subunit